MVTNSTKVKRHALTLAYLIGATYAPVSIAVDVVEGNDNWASIALHVIAGPLFLGTAIRRIAQDVLITKSDEKI